jgi:hypothetical protein
MKRVFEEPKNIITVVIACGSCASSHEEWP